MDVYQYKRETVELQLTDDDFPLVTDAIGATICGIADDATQRMERVDNLTARRPIVGTVAMALAIPRLMRDVEAVNGFARVGESICNGGMRQIEGYDSQIALQAITHGMAILARAREEPLTDMLATIHYHQLKKM